METAAQAAGMLAWWGTAIEDEARKRVTHRDRGAAERASKEALETCCLVHRDICPRNLLVAIAAQLMLEAPILHSDIISSQLRSTTSLQVVIEILACLPL